jgi:hypothetical protein
MSLNSLNSVGGCYIHVNTEAFLARLPNLAAMAVQKGVCKLTDTKRAEKTERGRAGVSQDLWSGVPKWVYSGRLFFVSVRTNKRHHHHHAPGRRWHVFGSPVGHGVVRGGIISDGGVG